MNYCRNCNKAYPDRQVFCSECGSRLEPMASTPTPPTNPTPPPSQTAPTQNNANQHQSDNFFQAHGGVFLGILSVIFGLWISWLVGLILGIFGLILSLNEKSQGLRVLAIICSIVGLLLGICGFIYYL